MGAPERAGTFDAMIGAAHRPQAGAGEISEGDERLRDFLELASGWFWELDENLCFTTFGGPPPFRPGELLAGRTPWEVHRGDPTRAPWKEHVDALLARRPFRDFEHQT